MELIVISASQLKIMLSSDDMEKYKLDSLGLDFKCDGSRQVFKEILREARELCGFDLGENRAFIQLFPSKKGGCEIFVSKAELGSVLRETYESDRDKPELVENICPQADHTSRYALRFDSLRDVLRLCRRILPYRSAVTSSSLWTDESSRYHLELVAGLESSSEHKTFEQVLYEYGTPESASELDLYIAEHGVPVCIGDAVFKLSVL